MQRNLPLIIILSLFVNSSVLASSLPALPVPETNTVVENTSSSTNDISTWQKVKNFFGIDNKDSSHQVESNKVLETASLRSTDAPKKENIDVEPTADDNKSKENENSVDIDKNLDIPDNFFEDVEKHLQEDDNITSNSSDSTAKEIPNNKDDSKNQGHLNEVQPTNTASINEAPLHTEVPIANSSNATKDDIDQINKTIDLPKQNPSPNIEEDKELKHVLEKPKEPEAIVITENSKAPKTIIDSQNFAVSKFKEEIERRNAKRSEDLKIISEKDLNGYDPTLQDVLITDSKQIKFITDEAKVLTLPNDEVVLGELTEDATLELMDFSSYVQIFWQNYDKIMRSDQRQVIEDFIHNYDENFNKIKFPLSTEDPYEKLSDAFAAIGKQDINKLIMILNNYPILEIKDLNNNSILHQAAYVGDYAAAKLLIMKGISLNGNNIHNETPLAIADKYDNPYVAYLLREAGALSFSK